MVIAQPFLTLTAEEPYRCTPETKAKQLEVLTKTLAVSLAARHGASKTHFTIFPEYSVPGIDGIALIDAALRAENWPLGTIVIGGTDALSKAEFATLAGAPNSHLDNVQNGLYRVADSEWVNCGITWIKSSDGTVERWLQPKLSRAWPEQNITCQDMFRGASVFAFRGAMDDGTPYRFATLVCFDWIASIVDKSAWRWVVEGLEQQAAQTGAEEISLSWFFVIQCNRKPSDASFLNEVSGFFDQTAFRTVRRERACLVFANSAGKDGPGCSDLYGCTSLVFSSQTLFCDPTCHPTFSNGGTRFRSSALLSAYRDVLFREKGACVHSFAQINPNSLRAGAASKTIAIEHAEVFPLNATADPRTPSAPVPACVKWLNDELDSLESLPTLYPTVPFVGAASATHQRSVADLRVLPAKTVNHMVKLATSKSNAKHADEWGQTEADAIEHLVHTLNIVGLGFANPTVGSDSAHATAFVNNQSVDILAIRGSSHEECHKHSKTHLAYPRRHTLLVSRDRDNNLWSQRFGCFLQADNPQLTQERRITEPGGGLLQIGYRKLLDIFQTSPTPEAVKEAIYAELVA
jgi:hypothetical protein